MGGSQDQSATALQREKPKSIFLAQATVYMIPIFLFRGLQFLLLIGRAINLVGLIPFALGANSICSLQVDNGKDIICYVHHPRVNAPIYSKTHHLELEKARGRVISTFHLHGMSFLSLDFASGQ